ncbi:hypothetical protein [Chishuiella changwenlii]|uniref:hypothetical protein n=1 Tax=Chishuiella changwenlii TaxID=1434701 RepID=UPI002FD9D7B2
MKKQFYNYTIQFIKEIIPVIAGILIALFIDNWNNDRKDKAYINQVFYTIDSELKDSKESILEIVPSQKSLVDSLEFYSNNNQLNVMDVIKKAGGVRVPQIKTSAWKSVSNYKIDLISYNKITTLSNIEEQKEILKDKSEFLLNMAYSNLYEKDKNKKQTVKMLLLDIIQTENTIHKLIDIYSKK